MLPHRMMHAHTHSDVIQFELTIKNIFASSTTEEIGLRIYSYWSPFSHLSISDASFVSPTMGDLRASTRVVHVKGGSAFFSHRENTVE